ncbi:hypothetical protein B0H11DRAFT_2225629 [Mycena galericulata]|nr:hypothetical protein B0H11DRAFT_2225629 [Mycena galericulata]
MPADRHHHRQRRGAVDYGTPEGTRPDVPHTISTSAYHVQPSAAHPTVSGSAFQPVFTPKGYFTPLHVPPRLVYSPAESPQGRFIQPPDSQPPLRQQPAARSTHPDCEQCKSDAYVAHQRSICPNPGPVVVPDKEFKAPRTIGPAGVIFESNSERGGVLLTDILRFRDCMKEPGAQILPCRPGSVPVSLFVGIAELNLKHNIPGNCKHRPITRFNLAWWIARAFTKEFDITNLMLFGMSTSDGTTWSVLARRVA